MSRIASPCVNICRMNPANGLCEGCGRTIDEIASWSQLDDAAQRTVIAAIEGRMQQASLPSTGLAEVPQ